MRRDVLLLLCSFYLLPLGAHADDSGLSAKDIKTLFFGHDDRKAVNRPEESPWDAIGQLETASGNLCTATLISPSGADRGPLSVNAAARQAGQSGRSALYFAQGRLGV
jgi:V8-like Glu-specific endopeptidase